MTPDDLRASGRDALDADGLEPVWASVGVVADLDGTQRADAVLAEVLRHLLPPRLGGAGVLLYRSRPPSALSIVEEWRGLERLAADDPDVVLALGDVAHEAVTTTGRGGRTVAGEASTVAVAGLLGAVVDPVAVDVRRRMLWHLGVLPDGPYTLDDRLLGALDDAWPLRPVDLLAVATGADRVDSDDPVLNELADPTSVENGMATVDGWVAAIVDELGDRRDVRLSAVTARLEQCRADAELERAAQAMALARLTAELDAARRRSDG